MGGVTPEPVSYTINNAFPAVVTVASEAEEGESVTVTAIGSGYYSIEVRITNTSGHVIAQTSDYVTAGGKLIFTMPEEPVYITTAAKPR